MGVSQPAANAAEGIEAAANAASFTQPCTHLDPTRPLFISPSPAALSHAIPVPENPPSRPPRGEPRWPGDHRTCSPAYVTTRPSRSAAASSAGRNELEPAAGLEVA